MTSQAMKREALNHAEAARMQRLGPGHWCGHATLGPGYGSGGSPPSNNDINYYYDALNRVTAVVNGSTFATIEYATCCSLRSKLTLGNGCYTEYEYDDAGRLIEIENKTSNATVISSWEYGYDDVGNVSSQTDKDSLVTSYTYDDIYELTYVNYPSGSDFGYEYDAVGNRTKMFEYTSSTITTTYTYDNADELTQWTTSTVTMTFTYASDGCVVSKSDGTDTWEYDWDYERRLAAFKKNSATLVEYTHNPTGTRRQASDSTLGVENYFHAGLQVLGEYSSNWSLVTSYMLGADAMLDRTTEPDTAYYVTRDRLGSTRELVSASETVNTGYAYDVWGKPTETQFSGSVSTDYRFRGWYYASTSDHYAGTGVDYDPGLGRTYQMLLIQLITNPYAGLSVAAVSLDPHDDDWGADCLLNAWADYWWCVECCDDHYDRCVRLRAITFVGELRQSEYRVGFDPSSIAPVVEHYPAATDRCQSKKDQCYDTCRFFYTMRYFKFWRQWSEEVLGCYVRDEDQSGVTYYNAANWKAYIRAGDFCPSDYVCGPLAGWPVWSSWFWSMKQCCDDNKKWRGPKPSFGDAVQECQGD